MYTIENKKYLAVSLTVTIIHFILTTAIGYYIAVQIGNQMGNIVASGLIKASDKNSDKAEEEAQRIHQNMRNRSDDIIEIWKIPNLLISLPAKPLITPLLKEMRAKQVNRVLNKKITMGQFRTRGLITDLAENFLNSLCFGVLLLIILRILNQYKRGT